MIIVIITVTIIIVIVSWKKSSIFWISDSTYSTKYNMKQTKNKLKITIKILYYISLSVMCRSTIW